MLARQVRRLHVVDLWIDAHLDPAHKEAGVHMGILHQEVVDVVLRMILVVLNAEQNLVLKRRMG